MASTLADAIELLELRTAIAAKEVAAWRKANAQRVEAVAALPVPDQEAASTALLVEALAPLLRVLDALERMGGRSH